MENIENNGNSQVKKINELTKNQDFIDFLCYNEDRWLQTVELKEKLIAVFGSVELAIKKFENDIVFNKLNI